MCSYSFSHLTDPALVRHLASLTARERGATAELLACLAEVDARKLHLPAGHPSMFSYCLSELHLCEQSAYKRIRAARVAREFPSVLQAVAEGRLHLSAIVLLAPYLTRENAEELLARAAHQTRAGIEGLLAERFPRTELLPMVWGQPAAPPPDELTPGTVEFHGLGDAGAQAEPERAARPGVSDGRPGPGAGSSARPGRHPARAAQVRGHQRAAAAPPALDQQPAA